MYMLDFIVMQMSKGNHEKGYSNQHVATQLLTKKIME